MKFFLRISILVFLFLSYSSCASNDMEERKGCIKLWDGWAGYYTDYNSKPFDFFYNEWREEINIKKLSKTEKPEILCKENSIKNRSDSLIRKMIGDSIIGSIHAKSEAEEERIGILLVKKYLREKDKIQVKECRPLAQPNSKIPNSEWRECECIVYLYIPGGKDTIIKEAKELQKLNQ